MNDIFKRFLYVRAGRGTSGAPGCLQALNNFCMQHTGLVRWSVADRDTVSEQMVLAAALIVIEWEDTTDGGERIFQMVRRWALSARDGGVLRPMIILRPANDRTPVEQAFVESHSGAVVVDPSAVVDPAKLRDALRDLKVDLPKRDVLDLASDVVEPAIRKIIQDVGLGQFDLVLQKYFPYESNPRLFPVEGGWSGDPLVRVRARIHTGEQKEFFLKFFTKSEKFTNEISKHEGAYEWLKAKGAAIPLHKVPEVGDSAIEQLTAFPSFGRAPVFPVCYISASADTVHKTYKDLFYEPRKPSDTGRALKRILAILDTGKSVVFAPAQPPFVGAMEKGPFVLADTRRTAILRNLGELDRYGAAACGAEWGACRDRLELLVYKPLGGELVRPREVAIGPIHGDTNPRNCLVNPDNPDDVLIIDCGDYDPNGRLVHDLALIERDIKLVLMGNEKRSESGFYDLDTHRLQEWCKAEKTSIERCLDYSSKDVAALETACPSAYAAHSLVLAIRKQAKTIRGIDDPDGRHYFAALLYWMIRALDERAIPPTKKLLTLYSMAQILRVLF